MNERESQLRLQAYLDGELQPGERRQAETQLALRADYGRLLDELKAVDAALVLAGDELHVPESREFYWSKIESAIHRAEAAEVEQPASSWLAQWRRWLMPAGAVACLALALSLTVYSPSGVRMQIEASVADPGTFTYRDFSEGTTLVWFSYPADSENEFE
jgi:anti-sigma-K factor RskA